MGRLGEPDDVLGHATIRAAVSPIRVATGPVAAAVLYLAGPSAGATTGASLAVDGGMAGIRLRPR